MKYTKGGFPFKSSPAKQHDKDDQSKEVAKKAGELCPKCGNRKGDCTCPPANLSKMSGLGPRTSFGGSKNPELDPSRELEDKAE
jgi:hypothetical protein